MVAIAVGVAILRGQWWGFVADIVIAILSAVGHFLFLPQYPMWAVLIIRLDITVIWGLARGRSQL